MSKHRESRRQVLESVDTDFNEVLLGERTGSAFLSQRAQRKTKQYCRQVQRALNLALADWSGGDSQFELFVEEVSPAPDCGHLLVHIAVQDGHSIAEAISALRTDVSRLRLELAMAISRKRAPELSFVPVIPEGGNDE